MTTIFSFHRVKLLFTKYFVERWRRDLQDFAVLFALCALSAFSFSFAHISIFFFVLFCFLSSAKFFSMFKNNSHGLDYLLIPANTLEKTVTGIILSQVYKVILYFIALALGIKFGSFLYSLHHTNIDGVLSIKELFTWVPDNLNFIFTFFTVQAFFLFASVFFKKNAFLKTIMFYFAYCVVLVFILFSIVFILENHTGLIKEAAYAANPFTFFNFTYENMTIFGKISTVVWSCIALLFPWVMSYLRLREKEV